jgi:hypothetical protein
LQKTCFKKYEAHNGRDPESIPLRHAELVSASHSWMVETLNPVQGDIAYMGAIHMVFMTPFASWSDRIKNDIRYRIRDILF